MSSILRGIITICMMLAISSHLFAQDKFTLSGYVKEKGSGELLPGVSVYIPSLKTGTSTNTYGFFSVTLKPGHYKLVISYIGYENITDSLDLSVNTERQYFMQEETKQLEEVVISSDKYHSDTEQTPMSVVRLTANDIKRTPALLGESDVLKTLQLLPGIQGGTEGSSGIYVRGGSPDQNLLILDEATVYNASHLFGFFSVFDGNALKSVETFKGGFPARFGGRLSSVIKMDMKDGNKEKVEGNFKIGLISSSLQLEGPIKKEKTSFLFNARRTYLDILSKPFQQDDIKGGYHFTDLNFKINHEINSANKLYLSTYYGRDKFYAREKDDDSSFKSSLGWGNVTTTLRWNHQFSGKLFANTSLIFSSYDFNIRNNEKYDGETYKLNYSSGIKDYGQKMEFEYFPNLSHEIRFGLVNTFHSFKPKALVTLDTEIEEDSEEVDKYNSVESALYVEDDWKLNDKLSVLAGVRLSLFNYKSLSYFRPEPRITASYKLSSGMAIKASYAQMNQYVHLLSNSGIGLPTDLWVSSTDKVAPQRSEQWAMGWAKNIGRKYSLNVEGYYKTMHDIISYKEGASFLILDDYESSRNITWEDNITSGKGWAYGAELLLKKNKGRFTGWLGYTLSWSQRQFDEINLGRKFNSKYDRRHDISLVGRYDLSEKIALSGTWVFNSGINYTLPEYRTLSVDSDFPISNGGYYNMGDSEYITEINNFRGENYHRADLGIEFKKMKPKGKIRTWTISVYNVYNHRNPFLYYFDNEYDTNTDTETTSLKKVSIFAIIPSFTYSLKF
ncbi:TonB-dependent receptor [Fulvivirga ligni]|uniref:TonB-dependent receptor n=1 Tax=Fulvivirga ligni TaxID=2904246 RepID=UPI001F328AA3|nr:TonB-dependent receptor [Fulvivirga ligni]UII19807.1 TonB-dependent receptor [Fulvivirga ligni]